MTDTNDGKWRKSRRSNATDSCVEVDGTLSRLRDSKNGAGPTLSVDVSALVGEIKRGRI